MTTGAWVFLVLALLGAVTILTILLVRKTRDYANISQRFKNIVDVQVETANLLAQKTRDYTNIYQRFKNIVDVEAETAKAQAAHARFLAEQTLAVQTMREDYQRKRVIYERLRAEVSLLEEDLEDISYGLYKPHYDFDTSEKYKEKLEAIRGQQKKMLREKTAAVCPTEWEVDGSKKEGRKMVEHNMKLMLRVFNNECDSAVLKVRWDNASKMLERVKTAYEAINELGELYHITISSKYLGFKLDEIRLTHEYQEKLNAEREEQRRIKEEMREEEKARREIEKAQRDAEDEEERRQKALEQARAELARAEGGKVDRLNDKIALLEKQLLEAQEIRRRATSMAELTRSGHVYIISNVGSFGKSMYKIGLTCRLEPMDRVRELGDASVPFSFDVHAMIYAEDAPTLENRLHKYFESRRVNLINNRKEFFYASLDEIENAAKAALPDINFTRVVEAKEYRETLAIRSEQKEKIEEPSAPAAEKFPEAL